MAIQLMDDSLSLRDQLIEAVEAIEAADPQSQRAAALRLMACGLRERDFTARSRGSASCDDAEVRDFLRSLLAQREMAAREAEAAGRFDVAERAREDIGVIREFLPAPLSAVELEQAIREVIADLDAGKLKDMGRCMEALKQRFADRIEPAQACKAVRAALS